MATTTAKQPKQRSRRTTLFRRYLRYSLTAVMVSMIVLFIIFTAFLYNYWQTDRMNTMLQNTQRISDRAEELLSDPEDATDVGKATVLLGNMLNLVSDSVNADFFITDPGGRVLLCRDQISMDFDIESNPYCAKHNGYFLPTYLAQRTTEDGYSTIAKLGGPYAGEDGKDTRCIVVGTAVTINGQHAYNVYAVSGTQNGLSGYILEIVKLFLAAAIISFLLTFALAYLFAYSLTKPLQEMSRLTKQYAKGDFSERIEVQGNDELHDLAVSLNDMAESLSILDESRKSFVANVSHELKTPMTSIGGFIDGILDGTIPKEQERHYLQLVSKEIKRLARLVVTMLTLSKIEAGEEDLTYTETDLQTLLFNALLSFENAIDEQGYEIRGFEDFPQVKVMADQDLLFQVCYNLFDNAVKFTNPGGFIRVAAEDLPDRVVVHISNSGKGISQKELKRIFERFYKVDKSRSEHVKGVGLGLNLAQNIVRLHGGEISADSDTEGVATFTFWIPKREIPQNDPAADALPAPEDGSDHT